MSTSTVYQVYLRALSFMAASWLCIGCPQRQRLATEYSERSDKEKRLGITLQRVDQEAIIQHLDSLDEDETERRRLFALYRSGEALDQFLLPEETISFDALEVMGEVVAESFHLNNGLLTGNFVRYCEYSSSVAGPLRYYGAKDGAFECFPLPHHIRDSVTDPEVKKFFSMMEDYAGHPWSARTVLFDSPRFGDGVGDAGAEQRLYLFENGSFVHTVYTGKYCKEPGIYIPSGSEVDIRTSEVPLESNYRVLDFEYYIVLPIESGESYVDYEGNEVKWEGAAGLVKSTAETIPTDVFVSRRGSLTDRRLKLCKMGYYDFRGIHYLVNADSSIEQFEFNWPRKSEKWTKLVGGPNLFAYSWSCLPTPAAVLSKNTVFIRWSMPYFKAGTVVTQCGNNLSNPEKKDEPLIFFVGEERPQLRTYSEVVELIQQNS